LTQIRDINPARFSCFLKPSLGSTDIQRIYWFTWCTAYQYVTASWSLL